MKYNEFDKDLTPREIYNKVIELLQVNPTTRYQMYQSINAPNTKIDYQLMKLLRGDLVDKKLYKGVWYYGLTKKFRDELKEYEEANKL